MPREKTGRGKKNFENLIKPSAKGKSKTLISADESAVLTHVAPETMRKKFSSATDVADPGTAGSPYFRIVDDGNFKRAELREGLGYGDNATITFIRFHGQLLQRDITRAQTIFVQRYGKDTVATIEHAEAVARECGELKSLCQNIDHIVTVLNERRRKTARTAATDILCKLFPDSVSEKYIDRCGREKKYTYQRKTNCAFRQKKH